MAASLLFGDEWTTTSLLIVDHKLSKLRDKPNHKFAPTNSNKHGPLVGGYGPQDAGKRAKTQPKLEARPKNNKMRHEREESNRKWQK